MPTYVIFSFLAAFLFALQYLFEKLTAKHAIKTRSGLLFYLYLSFIPFALLLPLFVKISWPQGVWNLIWLHSLSFFVGNFLFFTAIFKTDASVFAPLFQLQTAFVAIFAFLFLKERFPLVNYAWMALMITGAMLVAYEEKVKLKAFWQKPVLLVVASTFFYALSDFYSGFALERINFWNLTFWATFTYIALALTIVPFARSNLRISFKQFSPMLLVGVLGSLGYTALLRAYEENLTLSNAFALLSSVIVLTISVLASRLKPDLLEHHPAKVYLIRAVGVILVLFGALKISLGG